MVTSLRPAPLLRRLDRQGVIDLAALATLNEEGSIDTEVYRSILLRGSVSKAEYEDLVRRGLISQIFDVGTIERLRAQGVVNVSGDLRKAMTDAATQASASTERWAVIFGDFFVLGAYDIFF
jgi:hypothetical protein